MTEILLFGGTTEGRALAEFLSHNGIPFLLSVATVTGKEQAAGLKNLLVGRMTDEELHNAADKAGLVLDATHPYADIVSKKLRLACAELGTEYIRVLRDEPQKHEDVVYVSDAGEAVEYLNRTQGNILLTTGSKTAKNFTEVKNFKDRVFLRMLAAPENISECLSLGYRSRNIICMQGPFTREMNEATLRMTEAKTLVTKDTGTEGGFPEKLEAARRLGVRILVIKRPPETDGISLNEAKKLLKKRFRAKNAVRRFPLFVNLSDKTVKVIGGGKIATRRVKMLLEFCADVIVISPELTEELRELHDLGKISWINRRYENGVLQSADVVLAATDLREVNHAVMLEAKARRIPCSVADCAEEGDFWFPGLVLTDDLTIGLVSYDGDHGRVREAKKMVKEMFESETLDQGGKPGE